MFTDDSPFILADNRTARMSNPTTAYSLNKRFEALLPKKLIDGLSVLDLGACIGQAGYWALSGGASSYTGVEVQPKYINKMRRLLSDFDNADCQQSDILEFCESTSKQWDTVILSGVIYGFLDYYSVLRAATDKAKKYLTIDMLSFGEKNSSVPLISIKKDQKLNASTDLGSYVGIGCRINPAALTLILDSLGFECIDSNVEVSGVDIYAPNHGRYISRYKRSGKSMLTLQDKVKANGNPDFYW